MNTQINLIYFTETCTLYAAIYAMCGGFTNIVESWIKSNLFVRTLIATTTCLVIIQNVQRFGNSVLGDIPRSVGGGRPENAFVKLGANHTNLIAELNLPTTNVFSNTLVGPIAILFRSDKEIIFIEDTAKTFTNIVTNAVVNVITNVVTNSATNIIVTYRTNFSTTLTTNITRNVIRPSAKQIRADLVDAVIFSR